MSFGKYTGRVDEIKDEKGGEKTGRLEGKKENGEQTLVYRKLS